MSADAPRRLAPWSEKLASPSDEQAGDRGHQVVVDPQPAHRVVDGGVDAHRHLVRVLVGDALVHLEEVAVALARSTSLAEPLDGVGEVEVHAVLERADAACPASTIELGGAGGDVARHEVAEARVAALEEVVALAPRGSGRASGCRRGSCGTQMRPSLRSDSDISVSFDWNSSLGGMHVGWICV